MNYLCTKPHKMKKLILSLFLGAVCMTCAAQRPDNAFGYNEYNSRRRSLFDELPPTTRRDIVFFGDSITDGSEWDELFGNPHLKNRGINGDHAEWMIDRLKDVCNGKPKKIFIMAGVNDLGAHVSPDSTAMFVMRLVDSVRRGTPRTKIYLQSILPNNDSIRPKSAFLIKRIVETNVLLKKGAGDRGITYIDLYPLMTTPGTDEFSPEYTYDGLHPNGKGYIVWRDAIKKFVK